LSVPSASLSLSLLTFSLPPFPLLVKMVEKSAIELIGASITLPCGLTLPNRLVKCPMQETCAKPLTYDPPLDEWRNTYAEWANAKYGLIITGQVQVDIRFLSIAGDVVCHDQALTEPVVRKWKEWATIAQSAGTPCIVQLAHPGRMSPLGAGNRPADMAPLCPSSVPVALPGADSWLDRLALNKILGTPKAMTIAEIDEAIANFVRGAKVSREAGFAGCQIHGAHGFLVSQFLLPRTNQCTDTMAAHPRSAWRSYSAWCARCEPSVPRHSASQSSSIPQISGRRRPDTRRRPRADALAGQLRDDGLHRDLRRECREHNQQAA
jgi:hypothetical protein